MHIVNQRRCGRDRLHRLLHGRQRVRIEQRCLVGLAVLHQHGVGLLAHEFDQLVAVGDVDGLGGDVGLGGLLGLYLGWISYEAILVGLFASFLVGGFFAVALLVTRKANRNTHFAFGPFLIVGTLIAVLR